MIEEQSNNVQSDTINLLKRAEVQAFLRENEGTDEQRLVLDGRELMGLPAIIMAQQISGRRKARLKLPTFYAAEGIVFPPGVNMEQASSEKSAALKSSEILEHVERRNSLIDLTGGFGIDSYFFSRDFTTIDYVEVDPALALIAQSNHDTLGAQNIRHHVSTAEEFIRTFAGHADAVYLDPSRRDAANRRVVTFKDCQPDVVALVGDLLRAAQFVFIKASPMLDISKGITDLTSVKEVMITSVDNDCKELLFILSRNWVHEPVIKAVNISEEGISRFEFTFSEERKKQVQLSRPQQFLYEPNASIMKSGAFRSVAARFSLQKLHANTHLYTSDKLLHEFPGRIFSIVGRLKGAGAAVTNYLPDRKANVMVRNFPSSTEELKKQLKINDGGDRYVIGTTSIEGKTLLVADRLQ